MVAAAGAVHGDWHLIWRWRDDLSDHAILSAWPCGGRGPRGSPCTPAACKRLPGEAIEDLRR
eukprot:9024831-Lingulodinium_polyedra.AAC.1